MIKKSTWVQIEKVILTPEERLPTIPEDTKKTPLIMWVKGFLLNDSKIGEIVKIKTKTGRIEEGILKEANPSFKHNFGNFCEELNKIDEMVLKELYGDLNA
ncbi:MAG: 2-amino-4-oxopentanoate thiolase subunit OrtA [Bacilli bacterium]|nr:2-amino-4-oxopentanoate thiolase subunit OrtA [Bacilli bacterium]